MFMSTAMMVLDHKVIEIRSYHLMVKEVKRFDKVASAKLEKLMRVKNRDSLFCYGDNLCSVMKWVKTEEGYDYWAEVYEKLRQQRDLDFRKSVEEFNLF